MVRRSIQLLPEGHPDQETLRGEVDAILAAVNRPPDTTDELGGDGPDAYEKHKRAKLPKWLAPLGVFGLMLWMPRGCKCGRRKTRGWQTLHRRAGWWRQPETSADSA